MLDSVTEEDQEDDKVLLSKRPQNSDILQQKLPAWQPILTAGTVSPIFLVLAVAYIPIGVLLLVTSANVQEVEIDYTNCISSIDGRTPCWYLLQIQQLNGTETGDGYLRCSCEIPFRTNRSIRSDVVAYYGLTNFYQNYRQYVRSRDNGQLHGEVETSLSSNCEPYRYSNKSGVLLQVAPCGMIANSLFNDTFRMFYINFNSTREEIFINKSGIAWSTDKSRKFGKPPSSSWGGTTKPDNWPVNAQQRSPEAYADDEALVVWMRVAATPNFRKPYGTIRKNNSAQWSFTLPQGFYILQINYSFPVTSFRGSKKFILSTKSWLGGKNHAIGALYVSFGFLLMVLSLAFMILDHRARQRASW